MWKMWLWKVSVTSCSDHAIHNLDQLFVFIAPMPSHTTMLGDLLLRSLPYRIDCCAFVLQSRSMKPEVELSKHKVSLAYNMCEIPFQI